MYIVKHNGKEVEEFDTMREAEEFIDYKCANWPNKYDEGDFDIVLS